MTESVLVVSGDPSIRAFLENTLSTELPHVRSTVCGGGGEVVLELGRQDHDLALIDAATRAPGDEGDALWQWLAARHPHVPAILVGDGLEGDSAPPDHVPRLALPIDASTLAARVARTLDDSIFGDLRGVGLAAFLQLVELERKSCTIDVRDGERAGLLVVERGLLLHARHGDLAGDAAVVEMSCWPRPRLRVREAVDVPRNVVTRLAQLLLEAFRLFDERAMSHRAAGVERRDGGQSPEADAAPPPASPCTAEELLEIVPDLVHAFVVRRGDGEIVLAAGSPFDGDARAFTRAVAHAEETLAVATAPEPWGELVSSGGDRSTLVWRSARSPSALIVLVLRRNAAACALAAQRLRMRGW